VEDIINMVAAQTDANADGFVSLAEFETELLGQFDTNGKRGFKHNGGVNGSPLVREHYAAAKHLTADQGIASLIPNSLNINNAICTCSFLHNCFRVLVLYTVHVNVCLALKYLAI